jgi:predicted transposase YbfD/YdcC
MVKGFGKLEVKPQQKREAEILRNSVLSHFQHLQDPRVERTKDHSLVAIITIAILAVLSGANGFVAIQTYGKAKQAWLETFLDLPHGIPSHDTFGRVFAVLDPIELQNSFLGWIGSITEKLGLELIHVDGKTTKGSYDRESKLKALHTVSAWSSEHGLVLAQQKVDSKSNEITAVPLVLKLLNLKTTVVMVRSRRQLWNQTTTKVRFYISSLEADAHRHNRVIRSHWSIENSLHWVLDVTFNEDASRIRQGHAAENLGLLRRLSVNLLKREPSNQSLKMKRYRAAMDNNFLMKILAASAAA